MYRLVVFDLDGTLANTLVDLANAVNASLEHFNLPTHPVDSYNRFVGNGINNLISQVLMDKQNDKELHKKVKGYFDEYYAKHLCDNTVAYDSMDKVLSTLSDLNIKTAVHSNKPHEYVPQILSSLFKEHKFDAVIGNQQQYERKPSGQALVAIMQELGVQSDDVLYVGDSDVDVMTAHNANVKVCGVEWGFRGKAELESAGADFLAKNADELMNIIKG